MMIWGSPTATDIIRYCKAMRLENWTYWWGRFGHFPTQATLDAYRTRDWYQADAQDYWRTHLTNVRSHYDECNVRDVPRWLSGERFRVSDCIGFIRSYFEFDETEQSWSSWSAGRHPGAFPSDNENAMMQLVISSGYEWGDTTTDAAHNYGVPEIPGIFVWYSGHIGIYAGKGVVYECTDGRDQGTDHLGGRRWHGVILSRLPFAGGYGSGEDNRWMRWGKWPVPEMVYNAGRPFWFLKKFQSLNRGLRFIQ